MDKPVFETQDLIRQSRISGSNKSTITRINLDPIGLPTSVFEVTDYMSLRFSVSAKYNMGKRGQLNFFAHSTINGFSDYLPYNITVQETTDGIVTSNKSIRDAVKVSNTGTQFGLYYTFGTLTFK